GDDQQLPFLQGVVHLRVRRSRERVVGQRYESSALASAGRPRRSLLLPATTACGEYHQCEDRRRDTDRALHHISSRRTLDRSVVRTPNGARMLDLSRELRGGGLQLAQGCKACQRLALELADALAREVELVPDRLERPGLAIEAEAQLEDPPLALGQGVESAPHALAAERLLGLVKRVGGLAVGEEIAELALVVGSDGLVQRHRRLGRAQRLVDVLD